MFSNSILSVSREASSKRRMKLRINLEGCLALKSLEFCVHKGLSRKMPDTHCLTAELGGLGPHTLHAT